MSPASLVLTIGFIGACLCFAAAVLRLGRLQRNDHPDVPVMVRWARQRQFWSSSQGPAMEPTRTFARTAFIVGIACMVGLLLIGPGH